MICSPCLRAFVLVLTLAAVAGCATQPDRPRHRGSQGGFTVLTDGPGHPASSRVIADIGAFAQAQGFARQPARPGPPIDPVSHEAIPTAPERFQRDKLALEVSYQPSTHRVSAYLHSAESTRDLKAIERFFRDYHREYAPRYGAPDPISETAFSDPSIGGDYDGPDFNPGISGTRSAGLSGPSSY